MKKRSAESANDEIIGIVFRRAVLVVLLLAVIVASVLLLPTRPKQAGITDAGVTTPVTVEPAAAAPAVAFTDIGTEAGIRFSHFTGARGDKLLPETMGSGAAFFDYDSDGDADLLLVNSDEWPDQGYESEARPLMALYRNDGGNRFSDVTREAGLAVPMYGMGVATGDIDNDGDTDLLVTAYGHNRLFRNDGGRFSDVTADSGVAGAADAWSTSAAFFDADNDGDLDLFVANYVRWSPEIDFEVDFRLTGVGRAYGPPNAYAGTHSYLYLNKGDGRFTDISTSHGIQVSNPATGEPVGKALAVVPADIDGDGWIDLFVANDTVQNFLFHNQGEGRFEERGALAGVAFDRDGKATGAMGADVAHFRNDADLGLAIGNFANEMSSLYVTQMAALPFTDEAIVEGIGPASRRALTFGLFFFDYDLDGRLDLLQANGHLEGEINRVQSSQHYRQPAQLFWNCGADCEQGFLPVSADQLGDLAAPLVGRGAAYADIDADGDLDVVITQNGGPPLLLRNDQALGHDWLQVKLVGAADNRDGIGARVELHTANRVQRQQVMPARSYLSQVEPVLTFGLGDAGPVDYLEVRWPGGDVQRVETVEINALNIVSQQP